MRAVRVDEAGLAFGEHEVARARPGEVAVRVLQAGICETDYQIVAGYMHFAGILGHEFVGVAQSGPLAGQRVVGEINCGCGRCEACRGGLANHCPHRSVLGILNRDGAFADELWLPAGNLHAVPDAISTDAATFVEPLAAAFQIAEQVDLESEQRAVVLGDGRLGNLCAQVLRLSVGQVVVVGKHRSKLEVFRRQDFSTALLDEATRLGKHDLVVDCTGSASGLELALQLVRPRGTVVLKTTVAAAHTLSFAPVVIDEIRVIGSRCGPFPRALEALKRGEVDVRPLITERISLEQVPGFLQRPGASRFKTLVEVTPRPSP